MPPFRNLLGRKPQPNGLPVEGFDENHLSPHPRPGPIPMRRSCDSEPNEFKLSGTSDPPSTNTTKHNGRMQTDSSQSLTTAASTSLYDSHLSPQLQPPVMQCCSTKLTTNPHTHSPRHQRNKASGTDTRFLHDHQIITAIWSTRMNLSQYLANLSTPTAAHSYVPPLPPQHHYVNLHYVQH